MSKKKRNKSGPGKTRRLHFPNDEKDNPWLKLLIDSYYVVDKGVAGAIAIKEKNGTNLACREGCSTCCHTHKDIPLYPLELKGIAWYAAEKIKGPVREILKNQLARFKRNHSCPFLIEDSCSIHQVRPMACRQFNVFGTPCSEGEDPYYSRREDVMDPVKKYVDQAFFIMLSFHGIEKESDRIKIIEDGSIHKTVKELHACKWNHLADKMEKVDKK